MGVLLNHIGLNRNVLPSRPLENSRVIRDSAPHRKATVRANREGHDSLVRRRIIGGKRRKAQVTSREFLYHLPCSSSARKLEGFGSGWLAPETAVRTDRFVVNPPAFDDDLGFFQRVEQFPVEKLIARLCSVMPSFRQESSTARPLPLSSSTVRRC